MPQADADANTDYRIVRGIDDARLRRREGGAGRGATGPTAAAQRSEVVARTLIARNDPVYAGRARASAPVPACRAWRLGRSPSCR